MSYDGLDIYDPNRIALFSDESFFVVFTRFLSKIATRIDDINRGCHFFVAKSRKNL